MGKKRLFLLLILFLVIGFAAVSTTLVLTGTFTIGESDFKVVFSDAYINGEKSNYIITSEKTIEFTADLNTTGEKYVVDYTVLNKSTNYAADITLKYTGDTSEYISIKNEFDTATPLEAKKVRDGKITITVIKPTTEDITINVSYEITANALERDTISQYEEEISYLDNYESNLNTAESLLNVASDHVVQMLDENNHIKSTLYSLKNGSIDFDEANTTINDSIANINDLSATATYDDKNLIDGSMSEPYVVNLETTEYELPVYTINSTTLGLDNLDLSTPETTLNSIDDSYNSLQDYYTKIDGTSAVIDSLKTTLSSKKGTLYRIDTDDAVKDEIALKSANEILKKVREMQNLTYSWVRSEGYTTNSLLTNRLNSYIDSINLIVENENFKGINLLDGTYKDIPNLSTHHLGLNDGELFFDLSSKENVAITRNHLEYAVSKLKNYANDEYIYTDDLMYIYNEGESAKDAISFMQTAEGALTEIQDMLQRMNELQGRMLNDSTTDEYIEITKKEQDNLLQEIERIANDSFFNGIHMLSGSQSSFTFEFGRREEDIQLQNFRVNALGLSNLLNEEVSKGGELLNLAIDIVSNYRGYLGSLQNSYDFLIDSTNGKIEVLSKNNSEEETKKDLAENTIYNILNVLNRCEELALRANNGTIPKEVAKLILVEATHEIRIVDMMVDDARVNGQEILNGTYNNIPNLRSDYLGLNDTKLSFKSETESDLDNNVKNVEYAINKLHSVLTSLNN